MAVMLRGIFVLGIFLSVSGMVIAQDQPFFSFGKGVEVVAPDSSLSLRFQINLQNRIDLITESADDWSVDKFRARIRRFRLKFSGFIIDPRLSYKIQLALAPGLVKSATSGQSPQVMHDAMIYYQFNPRFSLGFGQTKLPANRQQISSSADQQFVDRSLVNSVFNVDRDFGLYAKYQINPSTVRPMVFHGAITTGEGRNWVNAEGAGLSFTGRFDWYPLGPFLRNSAYKESDLEWHPKPRLMAGISFNFNNRAQRSGGQRGGLLYEAKDISTLFMDIIYKHQGWAAQFAYIHRNTDDPITRNPTGNGRAYVFQGNGINFQISKYFRSNWEVAGRMSTVTPGDAILELEHERRQWVLGLNRYIKGRSIKLQADATLYQNRFQNNNFTDQLGFRVQAQIGF